MTAVPTGLARVTISAPNRRVDLAIPGSMPVAELLPELLRQAGAGLADEGERHGGWLLRRTDGAPLSNAANLPAQGVRDGEVLHLVPAGLGWPELEYDDVVEAIAASARQLGPGWRRAATRAAAIVASGIALAAALVAGVRVGTQWTVLLGFAVLLLVSGTVAARAYRDAIVGTALVAYAMPYALAGGAGLATGGQQRLLAGCLAVVVVALLGGAAGRWVCAAGATAGLLGVAGALIGVGPAPAGTAAILGAALACGIGALPPLAIRLGRLPIPSVRPLPARSNGSPSVQVAVRRTDELLTGMLIGYAVSTAAVAVVLVVSGGTAGRLLAGVIGAILLLRARVFAPVRQRVPVLAAGLAPLATLAGWAALAAPGGRGGAALVLALGALGFVVIAAGGTYAGRPPSPYLGRAADLLDTGLVVCVVPIACAVLGLYARVRGLAP
ncbi:MAG TPA: type VII secretion integral membrane protein EccD [Micromonosporaceae bacterium]|jgi:type VII secretion integral membrane protein EccD|nr:type VII secretion integral membrane protein EccD [Micromonosporaceae bacterium]